MSVYHKEKPEYFRLALEAVFNQTILPSEFVLVKDGVLTEELEDIIDDYVNHYPIFNIVENQTNIGLGLSLAKGLSLCTNEIVARMDSDDTMPTDRFEKEYNCIVNGGYDIVSCWSSFFENDIDEIIAVKKRPESHDDIVKLAKRRSPVSHAASMFCKSAVLRAGNYQNVGLYEDYHLWVRMIVSGSKFYNIQESLYYVRTSLEQVSRRGGLKYLINEVRVFGYFYKIGFISYPIYLENIISHSFVRLIPSKFRKFILKVIWRN
jgi:glycosyltransferase involved in cell wall biosynthesis